MDRNYLYPGHVSCIFCVRDDHSHPLVSLLKHQLCFSLSQGLFLLFSVSTSSSHLASLLQKKSEKGTGSRFIEKGQGIFFKISKKSIYLGAFFLGILFSIGWAPCALSLMMPVFILTLTQKISILMGGLLLFVFGLGHGVPIIPLCTATSSIRGKLGNKYVICW